MKAGSWLVRAVLCTAVGVWVLAGCGGSGVGSGGTGMTTGLTVGTVNGFGSVIVDGDHYDDSAIATYVETAPGVATQTVARLGERVEVEYEGGVVSRLRVDTALVGVVEALPADGLQVLGQAVVVNAASTAGPVTQFGGGYAGLASVSAGDIVAVHGFVVRNGAAWHWQATRVERLSNAPEFFTLSGIVDAQDGTGVSVGGVRVLTGGATTLPAGSVPSVGQPVAVLLPAASRVVVGGVTVQVQAAQLRVRAAAVSGQEIVTSGVIGAYDAAARRFDIAGVTIDASGAEVNPSGGSLAAGWYVQVRGTLQSDGSVRAAVVSVRGGAGQVEAELKGNVVGLDASGMHFTVRDVSVDASRAEIEDCRGGVTEGAYVQVEGRLGATGVVAEKVQCESEGGDSVVERSGVASSVDASAMSFVLTRSDGSTLQVRWSDATYFDNVSTAMLDGRAVQVEGKLVGGVLVATEVQLGSGGDR